MKRIISSVSINIDTKRQYSDEIYDEIIKKELYNGISHELNKNSDIVVSERKSKYDTIKEVEIFVATKEDVTQMMCILNSLKLQKPECSEQLDKLISLVMF